MGDFTFWDVLVWLGLLLGLGALVAGIFSETVRELLPKPKRIARWMKARNLPPSTGESFTVLVADLDDDGDGSQTRHIRNALLREEGLEVRLIGRQLRIETLGDQTEARLEAERRGRDWQRPAPSLPWTRLIVRCCG